MTVSNVKLREQQLFINKFLQTMRPSENPANMVMSSQVSTPTERNAVFSQFHGLRMVPNIERLYFRKKSELSAEIEKARKEYAIYRTPLFCECTDNTNYRTTGAVVVRLLTGEVEFYFIRCRNCADREGGSR